MERRVEVRSDMRPNPDDAPEADLDRLPDPDRPWPVRRRLAVIVAASLLAWALWAALALLVLWALRG